MQRRASRRIELRRWLLLGACTLALAGLSQALWWWQTLPVRQLLEKPATPAPVASARPQS
jgi:hypothetical protein